MASKELLELLVCPYDKTKVVAYDNFLKCPKCNRVYPVKKGIPVFV